MQIDAAIDEADDCVVICKLQERDSWVPLGVICVAVEGHILVGTHHRFCQVLQTSIIISQILFSFYSNC